MPDSPDKSKFVSDTFGEPLDVKRHATPERHEFGDALLIPDASDVAPVGAAGAVASAGISPKVARADHIHPFLGGGTGGVTDHGALTGLADDDHTQYLTAARGDALFLTPTEGNAAYDTIGAANAAVANHVAAADPHTVYLTQSEADALFLTPAEGNAAYSPTAHNHDAAYVNVNGDTMTAPLVLPAANPTTATQAAHKGYVDQQDSAHTGAADPHPIYLTPAEGNAAYDSLGAASTAVTNHVAAADPHTAYLKEAELLAGSNITLNKPGDGTVTINGTGSGGVTAHSALTGLSANDHPQYTLYQFASTLNVDTITGHGHWALPAGSTLTGTLPATPFAAASAFEFWQVEHTASTKLIQTIRQNTYSWQRVWGGSSWGAWSQFLDLATADARYERISNEILAVANIPANITPAGGTAVLSLGNVAVQGNRWYRFTCQFDCSAGLHVRNVVRCQIFGSPGMYKDFNWSVSASDAFMSQMFSVIYLTGAAETVIAPVMYHMSGAGTYYATGGTFGFYVERV